MVAVAATMLNDKTDMGKDPVRALAMGLRRLIVSGQHFRNLRARELHLGSSDLVALGHLHNDGSMAPKELSALMGVTSGTMTALLDRVEKAGFLKREHNPEDRRSLLIHLTPAGQHAMQWLHEQFDAAIRDSLTRVPELAIDGLNIVLDELSNSLDARAGTDEPARGGRIQPLTHEEPTRLHGV